MIIIDIDKPCGCIECPFYRCEQGLIFCGVTHELADKGCPIICDANIQGKEQYIIMDHEDGLLKSVKLNKDQCDIVKYLFANFQGSRIYNMSIMSMDDLEPEDIS